MERMFGLQVLEGFVRLSDSLASRWHRQQAPHLVLGRRGEEAAFFYLRRLGYIVVARDWRSGKVPGDLDLVAWEGSTLCFVEIKTRSSRDFATAESAVDAYKMRVLRRLARQYLLALSEPPEQTRFDVLSIYWDGRKPAEMELFRGAFRWWEHER
jgi:putative endonuclease